MPKIGAGVRIYTVVDVTRGVAVGAHSFRHLGVARAFMTRLRDGRDLQEDDVQLFSCVVDASEETRLHSRVASDGSKDDGGAP